MLALMFLFVCVALFYISSAYGHVHSARTCKLVEEQCPRELVAALRVDISQEDCVSECRSSVDCTGGYFAGGTQKTKRRKHPAACYLFGLQDATEPACEQPNTVASGERFLCEMKVCPTCTPPSHGYWVAFTIAISAVASFALGVSKLVRKLHEPPPVQIRLEHDAWDVRLQPADVGGALGIVVDLDETSGLLRVTSVAEDTALHRGAVAVNRRVKVGDYVLAVNNFRGPPAELAAAVRNGTDMYIGHVEIITFRRPRKRTKYLGIGALPVRKVESKEAVRTCALCLEDMEVGSEVRTLPCFHFFHASCSEEWLRRENSCPLCRCKNTVATVTVPVGDNVVAMGSP
jgi:hypothetical protein